MTADPTQTEPSETQVPVLQPGIPFGDYCDLDAVNATKLLTYRGRSCRAARYQQIHGIKETPSLLKGHALHAAVLEPDVFGKLYATQPTAKELGFNDFRPRAAQVARDKWLEEHVQSVNMTRDEWNATVFMRDSILSDPTTAQFFTGKGSSELTLTWTDKTTQLDCKGRVDRLTFYHNYPALVDIKTARDVDDRECEKAIFNYGYHIRLAWYLDALMAYRPGDFRVFIVWVQNSPPYEARYTELEDDPLREGRAQYRHLLDLHAECLKKNEWPGYPEGLPVGIPQWGYKLTVPRG